MDTSGTPRTFGRFVVRDRIGMGGMGAVYTATDPQFDRLVALKVMSGPIAGDPEFRERFRREATVLARLDSPHVTSIYDHGEEDGTLWIATQLVPGGELGELLRERGPLSPRMAVAVCAQVSDALHSSHSVGVVHRDVKPSNVLLRDADAPKLHAYLCDFGIAHTGGEALTATGGVAGTWSYLSPERGRGEPATPASDTYAVGCLLWCCLTGGPPYRGSDVDVALGHLQGPIPQVRAQGPLQMGLNRVLARALAKDPAHRYASALELRDDLAALERGDPDGLVAPTVAPAPAPEPIPHRGRRGRVIGASALVLLLAAGATGVWAAQRDDPGPGPGPTPNGPVQEGVTGDVNGDGFGDLSIRDWDSEDARTVTLASDGAKLGGPEETDLEGIWPVVAGDTDGDGADELVQSALTGDGAEVTLHTGGESTTTSVSADDTLPEGVDTPLLADVNGDGRDDLVLSTSSAYTGDQLDVWVATSNGDGFEPFTSAFSATKAFKEIVPGDFDGDGDDDFVLIGDMYDKVELLESNGSELEATGPASISSVLFNPSVGDFDGDGTDELVFAGTDYSTLALLRLEGDVWNDEIWLTGNADKLGLSAPNPATGVSDVNGDGKDDVIRFSEGEGPVERTIDIFASTGSEFDPPASWGTYTCECDSYFDQVLAYPST